jgi:putative transcriptional regulator
MNSEPTSNDKPDKFGMTPEDWARQDAMTDEEITAAALSDPDNQPLTDEQLARFRRPALVKRIRQKLRIGRETFSDAYGIPLDTLIAWERHEAEPSAAELAYLKLIEREPERSKLVPAK